MTNHPVLPGLLILLVLSIATACDDASYRSTNTAPVPNLKPSTPFAAAAVQHPDALVDLRPDLVNPQGRAAEDCQVVDQNWGFGTRRITELSARDMVSLVPLAGNGPFAALVARWQITGRESEATPIALSFDWVAADPQDTVQQDTVGHFRNPTASDPSWPDTNHWLFGSTATGLLLDIVLEGNQAAYYAIADNGAGDGGTPVVTLSMTTPDRVAIVQHNELAVVDVLGLDANREHRVVGIELVAEESGWSLFLVVVDESTAIPSLWEVSLDLAFGSRRVLKRVELPAEHQIAGLESSGSGQHLTWLVTSPEPLVARFQRSQSTLDIIANVPTPLRTYSHVSVDGREKLLLQHEEGLVLHDLRSGDTTVIQVDGDYHWIRTTDDQLELLTATHQEYDQVAWLHSVIVDPATGEVGPSMLRGRIGEHRDEYSFVFQAPQAVASHDGPWLLYFERAYVIAQQERFNFTELWYDLDQCNPSVP